MTTITTPEGVADYLRHTYVRSLPVETPNDGLGGHLNPREYSLQIFYAAETGKRAMEERVAPGLRAWGARLAFKLTGKPQYIRDGWEWVDTPEFAKWKADRSVS